MGVAFVEVADGEDAVDEGDGADGDGWEGDEDEGYGGVVGVGEASDVFKDVEAVALRNVF